MSESEQSAYICIDLGSYTVRLRMHARGSPELIKAALKRSCAHRRTILRLRPGEFICNVISHLVRLSGQDCVKFCSASDLGLGVNYHYLLSLESNIPTLDITEPHYKTPQKHPFFRWLGMQHIPRPKAPREYLGKRRGRKSRGRLENYFEPAPDVIPIGGIVTSTSKVPTNKPNTILTYDERYPAIPGLTRVRRVAAKPRSLYINFRSLPTAADFDRSDAIDEIPGGE